MVILCLLLRVLRAILLEGVSYLCQFKLCATNPVLIATRVRVAGSYCLLLSIGKVNLLQPPCSYCGAERVGEFHDQGLASRAGNACFRTSPCLMLADFS